MCAIAHLDRMNWFLPRVSGDGILKGKALERGLGWNPSVPDVPKTGALPTGNTPVLSASPSPLRHSFTPSTSLSATYSVTSSPMFRRASSWLTNSADIGTPFTSSW